MTAKLVIYIYTNKLYIHAGQNDVYLKQCLPFLCRQTF